jgi:hypothetical protein
MIQNNLAVRSENINFLPCAIPLCEETPRALICCAKEDIQYISTLIIKLYWEGFNFNYQEITDPTGVIEDECIIAFFSSNTAKSKDAVDLLKNAIKYDVSKIIQIFLDDSDWPDEIRVKLHDRQTIFKKRLSELSFMGNIREALRQFCCVLGHPRGFEIKNLGNSVEIAQFRTTNYSQVIIPETFFNPPLPVTSIGDRAFIADLDGHSGCHLLTHITLPDSLTHIGNAAFAACELLTSIIIPDGVVSIGECAFVSCKSLTAIILPEGITSIGEGAFEACKSLTDIILPEGITSIGRSTFNDCESLESINIPNNVTSLSGWAFCGCKSLTDIILPEGITNIDEYTFYGCEFLESLNIPNSVTSIGRCAFGDCTSLKDIIIHYGVTSIGDYAFRDCISLTDISLLNSITHIGEGAFLDCKELIIHTPLDSIAWHYAKENNIRCEPL